MVVDTSAIIAIFNEEADYQKIAAALSSSPTPCHISAASVLEAYIFTLRHKDETTWHDINEPLLFVGDDFTKTDITAAL